MYCGLHNPQHISISNAYLNARMRNTRKTGRIWVGQALHNEEVPNTTRVVGMLGHLVPELAIIMVSTSASDVYSFGVVMLEAMHKREKV